MTTQNIYSMTDTWNDGATTFSAIKMDVLDTASASGSLLMDLQVGGVSRAAITKGTTRAGSGVGGQLLLSNTANTNRVSVGFDGNNNPSIYGTGGFLSVRTADFVSQLNVNTVGVHIGSAAGALSFNGGYGSSGLGDLQLHRDAADTLAQRRSTNPQAFRLYNTYTDASNYERGYVKWNSNVLEIGAEAAGTGTKRGFRISGGASGHATIDFPVSASNASGTRIFTLANGRVNISNSSNGDGQLMLGFSSSQSGIKGNGTTLQVRLADDSAFTNVQGKITTETAYTAGAPTATGYLVLYDSAGVAYKVPAEAL